MVKDVLAVIVVVAVPAVVAIEMGAPAVAVVPTAICVGWTWLVGMVLLRAIDRRR